MLTLIVEDDKSSREIVDYIIQKECHSLTRLADGVQSAYDIMKTVKPDLIILDFWLVDGSAEDVLQKAKELYKEDLPKIILMTGIQKAADVAKRNNIEYLLEKPFTLDDLKNIVDGNNQTGYNYSQVGNNSDLSKGIKNG